MNEHSLHSAIKGWYSQPGDEFEARIDGFVVDILRGDLLIEIQTRNFSAIKSKLAKLLEAHEVRLVYPIPQLKWIIRTAKSGEIIGRRRSPRRGKLVDLFYELVRTAHLVNHERFSLEVLMIDEEEIRCNDGKGSWRRRGASIKDRRLVKVNGCAVFKDAEDFLRFMPPDLIEPFTNRMLAKMGGLRLNLARKITYCLRKMGVLETVGKQGRRLLFEVAS
jgi:hypothetical protein